MKRRSFLHSLLATAAVLASGGKGFAIEDAETLSSNLPIVGLQTGEWSHVTVTRSAAGMKMYLNGSQVNDIKGLSVRSNANNQMCVEHNGQAGPVICSEKAANLLVSNQDYTFSIWMKPVNTNAVQVSNVSLVGR